MSKVIDRKEVIAIARKLWTMLDDNMRANFEKDELAYYRFDDLLYVDPVLTLIKLLAYFKCVLDFMMWTIGLANEMSSLNINKVEIVASENDNLKIDDTAQVGSLQLDEAKEYFCKIISTDFVCLLLNSLKNEEVRKRYLKKINIIRKKYCNATICRRR